ncbi:hypothetical protein EV192_101189 [Actinocrispum wychmicini]|uniref:Uncharacterized protein n=2 Tax=Actinocrispum wychmicini TaxID=1213861 RepID=A0A4R2K3R6_9PSEU|nr:hypothetical protein EV192_101189 [Actinocrispum wychmicini]
MPAFGGAAGALVPVAGQAQEVRHKAEIGGLKLDPTAAKALIATLTRLHARVEDLVGDCADLGQPLKFGANFVGQTVAGRLRNTASGNAAAVTPVLTEFGQVLGDLLATVRAAAGSYVVTDETAARNMRQAAARFGLEVDV